MAITALYVDGSAGADTNGGSSEGAAIVSGASADTDGTAVVSLADDTPDLSGVSVGDSIFLAAETSGGQGSDSEVFEITAVNDGADTVTVTPTPGTNLNQSWAIGGAFATIDHGMNTVVAGNMLNVKSSVTYNELATMDTAGTQGSPVVVRGYDSTVTDGGRVTINGESPARANGILSGLGAVSAFYAFKNIIVTDCTGTGFAMTTATDRVTFKNCRAFLNGGWGFMGDNDIGFEACDAEENSSGGFDTDLGTKAVACRAWNNSGPGIVSTQNRVYYACLVYDNGAADGLNVGSGGVAIGCTADGENTGDEGIRSEDNANRTVIVNNIIHDWATGVAASVDQGELVIVYGNLYNSNTANTANIIEGDNRVEDVPGFTNEAGDDYTLTSGSAAKAAGIDAAKASLGTSYVDIGALQRQEAAAGGGLLVHPGTSGGARG